jgi:addiction module HigA family antidote
MTTKRYAYEPDYAVPPGATLDETIQSLGMDQRELAVRTGLTPKTINLIINGKAPITHETAVLLERVTGLPARTWNNLESNYREQLAKLEERKRLERDLAWLEEIPADELIRRKAIAPQKEKRDLLAAALSFFGVSSPAAWRKFWQCPRAAFRKSACFKGYPGPTAAWLRLGELEAQRIPCRPYDKEEFTKVLQHARGLSCRPIEDARKELVGPCAEVGVAVVFVPELTGCPASGVSRWLTPQKALIQLSLRYKTDDHLWFSFFHEAGHVLNDPKKDVFIDYGSQPEDDREKQANTFARNWLIPPTHASRLGSLTSKADVERFANALGIAPGIVVGRLQHDGVIPYSHMNALKRHLKWDEA